MRDFRVTVTVKNNNIMSLIESKGYRSVADFCKKNHLRAGDIGKFVNMTMTPLLKKGQWRPVVIKLAKALDTHPEVLFSLEQLEAFEKNEASFEMDIEEIQQFCLLSSTDDPSVLLNEGDMKKVLTKALSKISSKNAEILKLTFGIDCEPMTQEEIGKLYGITGESVRQRKVKAMRQLRMIDHRENEHELEMFNET